MKKHHTIEHFNRLAPERDKWKRKNWYYYQEILNFMRFHVPDESRVLEIGCGTGDLIAQLGTVSAVGIDISPKMIEIAQKKYPDNDFRVMDAEQLAFDPHEKFDYVILHDLLGYLDDVQKALVQLKQICHEGSRIIITYFNYFWEPIGKVAEMFHLKMKQNKINWLNIYDIENLVSLAELDCIKSGRRFLAFKNIPKISDFINRYVAPLPFFNLFCLYGFQLVRIKPKKRQYSVSVVIPARNEAGNIEKAILRTPEMGDWTEMIFIEGGSTDNTREVIQQMAEKYKDKRKIQWAVQNGKGKGDAVRKGFDMAKGEILMILDADLTVPPEDLPKFYNAISIGQGEFINGSRLVYSMEEKAMRPLNLLGNKFFSILFTWLLDNRYKDTLCGTKVLTKENYLKIADNRSYFGDFDPFGDFDLIFGAWKQNLKTIEIPIRYKERTYGNTNISRFTHGWLLLKMVFFAMKKIKFI